MSASVLITELDSERGTLPLHKLIRKLRDEVAAFNFQVNRGQSRELSLVVAKLEEAEGLAILAGVSRGTLAVVDRAKILQAAFPDATRTTVENEVANV